MTTTDLLKILSDNEYGAISRKPRNISLIINGKYMPEPRITLSSTGDGIAGPEIDLDIVGEFFEEQQPEDAISRDDALKALAYDIKSFEFKSGVGRHMNEIANLLNTIYEIQSDNIRALPPVQPKVGHCKDCKYFEYDHFENMGGIPLITVHKVCKRHGLICKTDEDGYCHLWEHKAESEE